MIAAVVNGLAIVLGAVLGVFLKKGLPERVRTVLTAGMGLGTMLIGLRGAVRTESELMLLLSLILGGALGAVIGIERRLSRFGERLQARFAAGGGEQDIGRAFVSATLIFCVGSMAIVGSLNAGLRGEYGTIFAKSLIDGVMSIVLASTMGIGVALSGAAVFIYQGAITLLAGLLKPVLTDRAVLEMSAVGGLLIMGIGLNMIRDRHLPVGDLLPSMFLPLVLVPLMG